MMNSKFYLPAFALIAASAMVSCSSEEAGEPGKSGSEAISFRTVLDNSLSRANTLTTATLEEFDVVCFDSSDAHYFGPIKVNGDGQGNWSYDGVYNWKGNGRHRFFAVARPGDATLDVTGTYPAINGFTVSPGCYFDAQNGAHGDGQYDLCTAYYEGTSADGPVALTFQHQLAKIEVKGFNSTDNRRIEVMGVRIVGLDRTGSWSYDEAYLAEDAAGAVRDGVKGSWTTDGAGDGDFCIRLSPSEQPVELTAAGVSLIGDEAFMVFPTVSDENPTGTTAWNGSEGTYISVICRVTLKDAAGRDNVIIPASGDADKFGMAMVPLALALEAGKKYTVNLDFSTGSGQVDPTVPSANVPGSTEPGDTNDDINDDSELLGPGDSYEGAPIQFTVTVADWTEADGVDVDFNTQNP